LVTAGARQCEQIHCLVIVELIDLQPATLCRQAPSEAIDEDSLPVMVHFHQRPGKCPARLRKNQIDHLAITMDR
jgi:hypothetical protein